MDIHVVTDTPDYLVVDKPAGLLVHETQHMEKDTLAAWLIERYPEIQHVGEDVKRPGMVHRLDREASGILVIAKTQQMFEHLKTQFQARSVEKEYIVLAHGRMERPYGTIDFPIDRGSAGRMVARPKTDLLKLKNVPYQEAGREALTEFFVEKQFARFALLRVKIHTGRTHQIRVHLMSFNHPVVGDTLYFNRKLNRKRDLALGRLFLHAARLCFDDRENARVCYESPLPQELASFLHDLA